MVPNTVDPELDPAVVPIDDARPGITFEAWLELVGEDEAVDLGIPTSELLAEVRERGEI